MKNFILTVVLGCSLFSCKKEIETNYRKVPFRVNSVKHYGVGQLNTLQLDPIWEIETTGGNHFKMRKPYYVGDTVWVYYIEKKLPKK